MSGAITNTLRVRPGLVALCSQSSLLTGTGSTASLQKCSFVTKALRDPDFVRPKAFPWREKTYNLARAMFDHVTPRLDENSKIIVVDGPPTGEKMDFAKRVADELDMLHIGPPNLDKLWINEYGQDLRDLNHKLPPSYRTFDIHQFLENPFHKKTTMLQDDLITVKFFDYMDAIAHLLNSGQGVVMNRSIYSDFVFVNTLVKHGFMKNDARDYFTSCKENGMYEFMQPHLIIYLDIPVDKVIANVRERNRPYELNSPFYKPEVLKTLEENYKKEYLKKMRSHCEILIYDWSEGGDAEVVVEDICRLQIDKKYTIYDTQMKDWRFDNEWEWKEKRILFSNPAYRDEMESWLRVSNGVVEEVLIPGEDALPIRNVFNEEPGYKYAPGFNKDMGDKYLFK